MASCAGNTAGDSSHAGTTSVGTTASATAAETQQEYLDQLPDDLDFGGETIRFIVAEGGNGDLTERSIMTEEDSADVVDVAVRQRNLEVEDRLNVKIELTEVGQRDDIHNKIKNSITAGSDDYDVIGVYQYFGVYMSAAGYIMPLDSMPYNDFTKSYWGSAYMDHMAYKNIHYWATGDLALRYIGGMYCTYVNKRLWNNYFPDDSIYDMVMGGKWTLDKMTECCEAVYSDLNGDGTKDADDQYGFVISLEDPIDGMAASSLITWSTLDSSGVPEITINNERTLNFFDKVYNLFYGGSATYVAASDDNIALMKKYASGTVLCTVNKLFQAEVYLRDMADDYYLIPVAKLDEDQEHYNTMLHDSVTLFGIPVTNKKVDATSAALEAMASGSAKLVTPAYYDNALKVKYSRDTESADMIDLIHSSVSSDFACVYSGSIGDIAHIFRTSLGSKKTDLSSKIEKSSKSWNSKLEKLLGQLEEHAET